MCVFYMYNQITVSSSRPQTTPSMQAPREGLVSYVEFLGPETISLHENGRLESDWSLLNKCVILTHYDS